MTFFGYNLTYFISKALKKMRLAAVIDSHVDSTAKLESGTSFFSSSISRYSFCGYDCDVSYCEIGAFTSIANGVVIGGARHPMEWVGMSPVFYKGRDSVSKKFSEHSLPGSARVIIGHDVWIGRSAIILAGVNIGNGAVVGAGSVVTKDIPPYAVAAGNPARIIKYRFAPQVVDQLELVKWWDFSDEELSKLGGAVTDVDAFLLAVGVKNNLSSSL